MFFFHIFERIPNMANDLPPSRGNVMLGARWCILPLIASLLSWLCFLFRDARGCLLLLVPPILGRGCVNLAVSSEYTSFNSW